MPDFPTSASGFDRCVKELDIIPVVETPPALAQNRTRTPVHPYTITPARGVKKIGQQMIIPEASNLPLVGKYRLVAQFNYSAIRDLSFSTNKATPAGFFDKSFLNFVHFALRYRVGSTVTRYLFPFTPTIQDTIDGLRDSAPSITAPPCWPMYTGQRVKKNFCIEVWSMRASGTFSWHGMRFNTSILANPSDVNQTALIDLSPAESLLWADLAIDMPELLPTAYSASSYWLDNV